jgi:hypothetical protein
MVATVARECGVPRRTSVSWYCLSLATGLRKEAVTKTKLSARCRLALFESMLVCNTKLQPCAASCRSRQLSMRFCSSVCCGKRASEATPQRNAAHVAALLRLLAFWCTAAAERLVSHLPARCACSGSFSLHDALFARVLHRSQALLFILQCFHYVLFARHLRPSMLRGVVAAATPPVGTAISETH